MQSRSRLQSRPNSAAASGASISQASISQASITAQTTARLKYVDFKLSLINSYNVTECGDLVIS